MGLYSNVVFRQHTLLVMSMVEKTINRLEEPKKFHTLLFTLGHRHRAYNVTPNFIELLGPQFVSSVKEKQMQICWTGDMEKSWLKLFTIISHTMREGFNVYN